MKKINKLQIGLYFLLSSCSINNNINKIESTTTVVKENKTIIKKKEVAKEPKISVFENCSNCYNSLNINSYFNSINYDKVYKTNKLIIKEIPNDLFNNKDIKMKKDVFFKTIYPLVYKANKEIETERNDVLKGKNIEKLMSKYKVDNIEDLKIRVDTIPASIVLAQAAIESAYGTSRFAEEGNALFGQWTTDKNGMTPKEKPNSKWKVARFDTPLDSVREYMLNVNTHSTYKYFRRLRAEKGRNPVFGLDKYSEESQKYIKTIMSVIKTNGLNSYR